MTIGATYRARNDFDRLPTPFRAIATDILSGEHVVIKKGSLGTAIRASIAVPLIFAREVTMQSAISFEKRSVKHGKPTNDLVLSSYTDGNERVFPRILKLYVSLGSEIADVTYGKGVFWHHVPDGLYKLHATDILCGVDCRNLPYGDGEIDCVVFDPPYMHTPGGTAHRTHKAFESHYRNNETHSDTGAKYHDAVVELYRSGGLEAHRVLRNRGVLIVKCQDEVCANRQRFTHVEIMLAYQDIGFICEDLFVVTRNNRPGVSRVVRQVHARKNHSYFLVFWKRQNGRSIWKPPT